MVKAGVPVVPGYQRGGSGTECVAWRQGQTDRYPVLIKAVAGAAAKAHAAWSEEARRVSGGAGTAHVQRPRRPYEQ